MANGPQIAADPVPAGKDASSAPPEQASPDAAVKAPVSIPTGFPEAAAADAADEPRRVPQKAGNVILATVPPLGSLTVPPLGDEGESVVIGQEGTEVDPATALRAYRAASQSGLALREL